jgi:hypothetical protein
MTRTIPLIGAGICTYMLGLVNWVVNYACYVSMDGRLIAILTNIVNEIYECPICTRYMHLVQFN